MQKQMLLLTLQQQQKKGSIHHNFDEIIKINSSLTKSLVYSLAKKKTKKIVYSHLTAVIESISKLDVPCCLIDE